MGLSWDQKTGVWRASLSWDESRVDSQTQTVVYMISQDQVEQRQEKGTAFVQVKPEGQGSGQVESPQEPLFSPPWKST